MNIKTIKRGFRSLISPFQHLLGPVSVVSTYTEQPISISEFKVIFDRELGLYFETKRLELLRLVGGVQGHIILELYDQAVRITLAGGKRIRPYMAYLAYVSGTGQVSLSQEQVIRSTMCLELFHIFALIHDDIIDTAEFRHSQKTIQNFFTEMSFQLFAEQRDLSKQVRVGTQIPHIGQSHAIMIGDLFLSMAHEVISTHVPLDIQSAVRQHFNTMSCEVVVGEMLDVHQTMFEEVSDSEILQKTELKTAHYTFVNPMKIGFDLRGMPAYVSGTDTPSRSSAFANAFGYELGIGFQIQDDLLDILGSNIKTGKTAMIDIAEGQHTVFTQYIKNAAGSAISDADRVRFSSLLGKRSRQASDLTDDERVFIGDLMHRSGAIEYGKDKISSHIARAKSYLAEADIEHKDTWAAIIAMLEHRNH